MRFTRPESNNDILNSMLGQCFAFGSSKAMGVTSLSPVVGRLR
jgi:hypothetical protein